FMAIFPVAGLDDGRFHLSHVPPWLMLAGYMLMLVGHVGLTWVLRYNKFAEPSVSMQTDRGHHGIDTGPLRPRPPPLLRLDRLPLPRHAARLMFLLGTRPLAACLPPARRANRDGRPAVARRTGRL